MTDMKKKGAKKAGSLLAKKVDIFMDELINERDSLIPSEISGMVAELWRRLLEASLRGEMQTHLAAEKVKAYAPQEEECESEILGHVVGYNSSDMALSLEMQGCDNVFDRVEQPRETECLDETFVPA